MKTNSADCPIKVGFSCLRMKDEIQQKIYEETKDLSLEERMSYFNRKADSALERYDTPCRLASGVYRMEKHGEPLIKRNADGTLF